MLLKLGPNNPSLVQVKSGVVVKRAARTALDGRKVEEFRKGSTKLVGGKTKKAIATVCGESYD